MSNTDPISTFQPAVMVKEPSSEENSALHAPTAPVSEPPVDATSEKAPDTHMNRDRGIVTTVSSESEAIASAPTDKFVAPTDMSAEPLVHCASSISSEQTTTTKETAAARASRVMLPDSLSAPEVQEIVTKSIQQCVNVCSASFSCGSSTVLPCAPTVTLLGDDGAAKGEPILLHRPSIVGNTRKEIFKKQDSQLEHLMSMMPRAAFGKGGDTVVDTSVRDALQLDATKFSLNIPQETIDNILANVKVSLDLQTDVVAEQYSLNLYKTGGMFKKHKDTPRGEDMLGTLVICLPTLFEGGSMKVSQKGQEERYFQRYSLPHCSNGSEEAVDNRIEWCAFFSDVDHEILSVTGGIRVTAAYILRRKDNASSSDCIPRQLEGQQQADRVRDSFLLGLLDKRFLSNGGKIGCACTFQYTNQQVFPGNKDSSQPLDARQIQKLKGNDLLIASAAVSAGLSVHLVPHVGHTYSCDGEGDYPLKKFPLKKKCPRYMDDDTIIDFFNATQGAGQLQNEVDIWISDMDDAASTSAGYTEWNAEGYFGNEASDIAFYVNACLVIEVPEYSESRGVSNVTAVEVDVKPKAKAKKRKSEDSEDSQKQPNKKKKDKKAKDPNAPKRNISAYMHYAKDTRSIIKSSQPHLSPAETTKVLSENWKALSSHERTIWDAKAAADKVRYQNDLAEYKESDQYAKWEALQAEAEETKPSSSDSISISDDNSKKTKPSKKKKDKKAADPNAPKRNISAYMHYAKDTRDNVKASQPGLTFGDISKVVSTNWKALSDQERAIWDEKAAADKVRYQKDLAEYEATEATAEDIVAKMLADDEK